MTCIAAVVKDGVGYIGGERGLSTSNTIIQMAEPKVWKSGDYLIGFFGSCAVEKIKYNFSPPALPGSKIDIDYFMNTTFISELHNVYESLNIPKQEEIGLIVIIAGNIYLHNGEDMSMTRIKSDYFAEGSGGEYALGSLYSTTKEDPKNRLKAALEAAIQFSPTCMGPIDIINSKAASRGN